MEVKRRREREILFDMFSRLQSVFFLFPKTQRCWKNHHSRKERNEFRIPRFQHQQRRFNRFFHKVKRHENINNSIPGMKCRGLAALSFFLFSVTTNSNSSLRPLRIIKHSITILDVALVDIFLAARIAVFEECHVRDISSDVVALLE